METNSMPQATPPKSNRNVIIGVVIALVLCCCLVLTGVGGYYAYQAYLATQQVVEDLEDFPIPTDVPFIPSDPNATPDSPSFDTSGETPEGGLADEETRVFAWASVQLVGIMSGCNTPTVEGTTITVTQQPDASGVWYEDWNVNCGDGTTKTFPIKFTPENGIVNVEVEFQP